MPLVAEGPNYLIEISDRDAARADCRVWRRPDLDLAAGARCAEELSTALRRLALDLGGPRQLVFDLRDAPTIAGPKTIESLGAMLSAWDRAGKQVVLVVKDGMQRLQMARLLQEHAPRHGQVASSPDAAPTVPPASSQRRR